MKKDYKSTLYIWLLFLLSPFLTLLYSLRNNNPGWAKNILWAFIVFYGFNFVISDDKMDANRYAENFIILHNKEITFENFLSSLLTDEESSFLDFACPVIQFIVSRFTDNPSALFGSFAIIYGFFYTRNLWFLLDKVEGKLPVLSVAIFSIVALAMPFWSINGFRFWAASHIFLYGLLQYLYGERNRKHLLMASVSILFHFSFIIPLVIVISSSVVKWNLKVLFYLFLASFLVTSFNLQPLQDFLMRYSPAIFQKKLHTYVNQDYADSIETAKQSTKWFVIMRSDFLRYFALLLATLVYFRSSEILKKNPVYLYVFAFILFFSSVTNIIGIIPSVGRFQMISYFLLYGFVFLILQHYWWEVRAIKRAVLVCLPLIVFFVVFQFRLGFQTINVLTFIGNPLISIVDPGMAMIDFIKN
ncbi:EpsG family protein [Desertivirga arenae]|uniref:EpsG family protein n=1 Tax=Desertivirga arenae TaxID=2810309 RepID=UPI001A96E51B|nr:EpsG family protein [Pedobacter sp. SYSU D00823]